MTAFDELVDLLRQRPPRELLVVTGAGVSLASGLPTFRGKDPGAIWAEDILEKGTYRYIEREPVAFWRWYLDRFGSLQGAAPNPSHEALVELESMHGERGGEFLLVTQNVDGLHRRAGSRALVEVHGRADRVRCTQLGCTDGAPRGSLPYRSKAYSDFLDEPRLEALPRCANCSALLRPHVLWFDETYNEHDDYEFHRVIDMAERAQVVLFAGTSFSVGVTELVLQGTRMRLVPVYNIDPAAQEKIPGVRTIPMAAEEALPQLVTALR